MIVVVSLLQGTSKTTVIRLFDARTGAEWKGMCGRGISRCPTTYISNWKKQILPQS